VVSEDYLFRDWSRRKLALVPDDSVKPHRRVPILRRNSEDAAGQGKSKTYTGCGRRHLKLRWRHDCQQLADSAELGGSHYCTIVDSDEYPTAGQVADVDVLAVQVEAQRLQPAVLQRRGGGRFGGIVESMEFGQPNRAIE
jgi:hypothetical protein